MVILGDNEPRSKTDVGSSIDLKNVFGIKINYKQSKNFEIIKLKKNEIKTFYSEKKTIVLRRIGDDGVKWVIFDNYDGTIQIGEL